MTTTYKFGVIILAGALASQILGCSGKTIAEEENSSAKDAKTAAYADAEGNELDKDDKKGSKAPAPENTPNAAAVSEGNYRQFQDARQRKDYVRLQQLAGEILSKNPGDTRVLNALAASAIEQDKYDLARLYTEKVLAKDPNNAGAYNNLGVVELKTDNLRLALIQFKKATAFDARNRFAHANLGAIYLKYRNYNNAAEELKDAVENGDQSPETLSNLGFALTGTGDYNNAAKYYERALAKDSSNTTILLNYGVLLVDKLHKNKEGLKVLNKVRFIAREPAIISKVENLLKKAENPGSQAGEEKGVSP